MGFVVLPLLESQHPQQMAGLEMFWLPGKNVHVESAGLIKQAQLMTFHRPTQPGRGRRILLLKNGRLFTLLLLLLFLGEAILLDVTVRARERQAVGS